MSRRGIVRLVIGAAEVDDLGVDTPEGIIVGECRRRVTVSGGDHRALRVAVSPVPAELPRGRGVSCRRPRSSDASRSDTVISLFSGVERARSWPARALAGLLTTFAARGLLLRLVSAASAAAAAATLAAARALAALAGGTGRVRDRRRPRLTHSFLSQLLVLLVVLDAWPMIFRHLCTPSFATFARIPHSCGKDTWPAPLPGPDDVGVTLREASPRSVAVRNNLLSLGLGALVHQVGRFGLAPENRACQLFDLLVGGVWRYWRHLRVAANV